MTNNEPCKHGRWPFLLFVVLWTCRPGLARPQGAQDLQSPIYEGYVIYEGQYVEPPYEFTWDNGLLMINDLPMQLPRPGQLSRRPQDGAQRGQRFRMPPNRARAWLRRRLTQPSVLFCWADRPAVFAGQERGVEVLQILVGDGTVDEKLERLNRDLLPAMKQNQRKALVQNFVVSDSLLLRLEPEGQLITVTSEEKEEDWYSDRFVSTMTLSGFCLAVLALGTLLSTRQSTTAESDPRAPTQVIRLIGLIVVLNGYDLVCTLYAHGIGGLWELNPFAGSILDRTAMVVTFKLGLTFGAAILFFVGRHLRIAQVGIYWIGVLYTVLILRWITYNAMFI